MKVLVIDTESSDMPLFSARSADPAQPHICEVAAILADGDTVLDSFDTLVRPDGWTCSEGSREVHGISDEELATGVDEVQAVRAIGAMIDRGVEAFVGFAVRFDTRMLRIAAARFPDGGLCGQKVAALPVIDLAPMLRKYLGTRSLTLGEAYERCIGSPMKGAHRAKADTAATFALYQFALSAGLIEPQAPMVVASFAAQEARPVRGGPCDD